VTLGALDDPLKNIDTYGDFLVGFDAASGLVEPEPGAGLETALTLQLTVQDDLAEAKAPRRKTSSVSRIPSCLFV
jgi:putative ATP-dependent endonuclease of OLD family